MSGPLAPLVLKGDCLVELARIPDASVDAVVTDPPYGIDFMGKDWDKAVRLAAGMLGQIAAGNERSDRGPLAKGGTHSQGYKNHDGLAFEIWCTRWAAECLRILKPGGHMLAFGGSRTWHRLAAGIEDAGFEIRDSIAWLYGSGFPKSMDVSKAIDKRRDWQALANLQHAVKAAREALGISQSEAARRMGLIPEGEKLRGGGFMWFETGMRIPSRDEYPRLKSALALGDEADAAFEAAEREITGYHAATAPGQNMQALDGKAPKMVNPERRDKPATDAAREWEGWGTALKPAFEPIVVARKPLGEKTVAANVLAHGTGALNIDATRIGAEARHNPAAGNKPGGAAYMMSATGMPQDAEGRDTIGRWPANVILDESQAAALDAQAPKTGAAAKASGATRTGSFKSDSMAGAFSGTTDEAPFYGELGGASRFFYVAKAPKSERPVVDGTAHPTVKPLALMRWLIRLVTPPGGCIVDPFAGSGTTLEAAYLEGVESIGVEMTPDYWPLIAARIERVTR